jgi:hypothetical protein
VARRTQRLDTRNQLCNPKWLAEVIVGTQIERFDFVPFTSTA